MKKPILDAATAALKLERMAYQILEDNQGEKELVLAGIATNGGIIANNIRSILSKISDIHIHSLLIQLDKKKPAQIMLSEPFDFKDKLIIVVDDVSNSGKTMLYALKPFLDSHPKKIQTLVLVERTHKAFPVLSNYVGLSVATTLQEHIIVEVAGDHVTGAYLE